MSPHSRLALGFALLSISGCGESTPVDRGRELRLAVLSASALRTLDPIRSADLVQYDFDNQIFEGLVSVGLDGDFEPAIAERWSHNEDASVWTFHIGESYFADAPEFQDGVGRRVTAEDVVYSWMRGIDPANGSLNSWALTEVVQGADEFVEGRSKRISGLAALDDFVLRVQLNRPDRCFLSRLTVPSTLVVPREVVDLRGAGFGSEPVGSGPFRLAAWSPSESLRLERNPRNPLWRGRKSVNSLKAVTYRFYRSEAQVAAAYDRGEIDLRPVTAADVAQGSESLATLRERHPDSIVESPGGVAKLHLLAAAIGPSFAFGNDATGRRALSAVFPRERLAGVLGPLGEAVDSLALPERFIKGSPGRASVPFSAGGEHVHQRGEARVAFVSSRVNDSIVQLLGEVLESRGLKLRRFPAPSVASLFGSLGETRPDLTLIYWSPYFPDLASYLTPLLTRAQPVPNFTLYSNQELDRLAEELCTIPDPHSARKRIAEILDAEMPWIPVFMETPQIVRRKHVQGFAISPVSVSTLRNVEIR